MDGPGQAGGSQDIQAVLKTVSVFSNLLPIRQSRSSSFQRQGFNLTARMLHNFCFQQSIHVLSSSAHTSCAEVFELRIAGEHFSPAAQNACVTRHRPRRLCNQRPPRKRKHMREELTEDRSSRDESASEPGSRLSTLDLCVLRRRQSSHSACPRRSVHLDTDIHNFTVYNLRQRMEDRVCKTSRINPNVYQSAVGGGESTKVAQMSLRDGQFSKAWTRTQQTKCIITHFATIVLAVELKAVHVKGS
ncbi:hypothetical protein B0H19DRAFT_1244691 [Mycena capillaripes]|nr:hypothetical protein B0H19DRAFT_1244691 [Mycena capillaripes]